MKKITQYQKGLRFAYHCCDCNYCRERKRELNRSLVTGNVEVLEKNEHNTDSPKCWCSPRIEVMPNGDKIIIHNEIN